MKILTVGLLIAGIASIFLAAGCGGGQSGVTPVASVEEAPTATSIPAPALVRAKDIVDEFEGNSLAATSKYTGKVITVTGDIGSVDYTANAWGDYSEQFPYVGIDRGFFCIISEEEAASLTAGSEVTVSAEFLYYDGSGWVYFKPCSIVSTG